MGVVFLITTCNRQKSCQRLVDALQGQGDIFVLNDGCDYDITGAKQEKLRVRLGKKGYWRTINYLYKLRGKYDYYIQLPDDFLPEENMVQRAIEIWESIKDKNKICLNLYADRIGKPCWTGVMPIEYDTYRKTQWVDMCFLCEDSFFIALGDIPKINLGWGINSKKSSGVGAYISKFLNKKKYGLYQVKESLVAPQEEHFIKSQMLESNDTNSWNSNSARTHTTFDTRIR